MDPNVSKRQVVTSLLSMAAVLGGLYFLFYYFGLTNVQEAIARAGIWAPLVLVLAKASTIIIAPLSGSPLYPLAGAVFGFWEGSLLLLLGDMLGGTVAFIISRYFSRHVVEKMMGGDEKVMAKALKMMGTIKGFFIARVCFAFMPEIVAYGAGLTRINFIPFFLIYSAVGIIPVVVFAGIGSALTLSTWWVLPLALVAGMIVVPIGFFVFRSMLLQWEKKQ